MQQVLVEHPVPKWPERAFGAFPGHRIFAQQRLFRAALSCVST